MLTAIRPVGHELWPMGSNGKKSPRYSHGRSRQGRPGGSVLSGPATGSARVLGERPNDDSVDPTDYGIVGELPASMMPILCRRLKRQLPPVHTVAHRMCGCVHETVFVWHSGGHPSQQLHMRSTQSPGCPM